MPPVSDPKTGGTRYYTFAPGKAPTTRKGDEIHLLPGQTLHFASGRGYYAGPGGPQNAASRGWAPGGNYGYNTGGPLVVTQTGQYVPGSAGGGGGGGKKVTIKKPVDPYAGLTNAQIQARAEAIARGQLLPQQQEIRRQQGIAAREARQQEEAIQGFSTAAAGIEGGMAPAVSQAYSTATQDVGALGQGLSTDISQDVSAQQAHDQALAAQQGIATKDTLDASALHDTMYGITGLVPGTSLAERGAAAATEAAGVPQVQLAAGHQELQKAMADAVQKNDDYAQQLIQVAAQFPGLKATALQTLNQYELDKADYREKVREFNQTYVIQLRAEKAAEKTAGRLTPYQAAQLKLQKQKFAAEYKYKYAGLSFRKKQDAIKASTSGKVIDVAASKLLGWVHYKDGTEDKSITVLKDVPAGTSGAAGRRATAVHRRGAAVLAAGKTATTVATKALGTPIRAPKPGQFVTTKVGVYRAAPWAKGKGVIKGSSDYPYDTTNNVHLAQRTGRAAGWGAVQSQVWSAINGDQLMAQFGLSRQQVLTLINRAMAGAGWKRKFSGG